jgi:superfamily II DNA/RNA helicase
MPCCAGKTLAFLLPALIHIDRQPIPRSRRRRANVLVLVPTSELALQIEKEVKNINYRSIKWLVFALTFLDYQGRVYGDMNLS